MRSLILLIVVAIAVGLAAFVPIPNSFQARGFLDFDDKSPIYATQTSAILFVVPDGAELKKDQVILELDCPEKVLELKNLEDEISSARTKYSLLQKSAVNDVTASFELPSLLELSKELETRFKLIEPDLIALVQKAPSDGFFLSATTKISASLTPPQHAGRSYSPTHSSNLGCTIERGTLLGWFTSKKTVLFQTLVPESDIKALRIGMIAFGRLDSKPSRAVPCSIKKISPEPIEEIPIELIGDPVVVAVRNQKGAMQPETPHYLITLESRGQISSTKKGSVGTVHFQLEPKTIAERVGDYLRATFRQR